MHRLRDRRYRQLANRIRKDCHDSMIIVCLRVTTQLGGGTIIGTYLSCCAENVPPANDFLGTVLMAALGRLR